MKLPLSKLNAAQKEAATAASGKNLVIASAGTGKTSTIVARIAHLLQSGVSPNKILLLTFTNKAASEMLSRLERFFSPQVVSQITAGTFHSVSNLLLREAGEKVVLKQPSELKVLLKSVLSRRDFVRLSEKKAYSAAYLYEVYGMFLNSCVNGEDFAEWFAKNYADQAEFSEIYADVLREFEEEKKAFFYADFNDLLLKMKEVLGRVKFEFDELLVDEYQDTNSLQGSLIDSFGAKGLFCVGDFDQSIYAFNGANIDIIASFAARYKEAKIFALNTNYRSCASILALANRVISNNPRLYPKQLKVGKEGANTPPRLLVYADNFAQYIAIAEQIATSFTPPSQIAVIFRNNSSADGLEMALREKGVSYKRKDSASFFAGREIKALTDLLGICVNGRDIMSFINLFEYARGVGAAAAKEVFEILSAVGSGSVVKGLLEPNLEANYTNKRKINTAMGLFADFSEFLPSSRFSNLNFDEEFMQNPALFHSKLSPNGAVFLRDLRDFLRYASKCKDAAACTQMALSSKVYASVVEVLATKIATLKNGSVDAKIFAEARDKIYAKASTLTQFAKRLKDLRNFYNFLTLGASELESGEGVSLLTIHASKGLEFEEVFLCDVANGRFPNTKLMTSLEEERRLFYVAVTRAKERLVLSYAKHDKARKASYEASIFLREAVLL